MADTHDVKTCELCSLNHPLMRIRCVAARLGLAAKTIEDRGAQTAHFRRVKQGNRRLFFVRAQVEAHLAALCKGKTCSDDDPQCVKVFDEESDEQLKLVRAS